MDIQSLSQQEHITADYDMRQQKATLHQIHPNGQLTLDLTPEEAKACVLEVDLNSDFFHKLQVQASTNAQWDPEGIDSIRIELRYGPPGSDGGDWAQHADLLLNKATPTQSWETFVVRDRGNADDAPIVLWYDYRVTVNYRAEVTLGTESGEVSSRGALGADGDGWFKGSYARNLVIDPRDATGMRPLRLSTGVLQFDLVQEAHVDLATGAYRETFRLLPDMHDVSLVARVSGDGQPAYHTTGTLFYKDGAHVDLPDTEWPAGQAQIVIDEPRDGVLRVRIIESDPASEFTKVMVTMHYEDGDRVVEKDFELTAHGQSVDFSVRLDHSDHRAYRYRTTLMRTSGAIETSDWIDADGTTKTLLIVGRTAADVIPIIVTCLEPVPTPRLLAIRVDLDYSDADNQVHWTHSELIRAGFLGSFKWAVPIADPDKRTYRYKITAFRPSGPQELDWTDTDETDLVLPLLGG
jgi:hypothetical protein